MTEDIQADVTAEPFGSLSILVIHPNPRMHRPDAHRWTRGFALKDLQFP